MFLRIVHVLLGLMSAGNGVYMLAAPDKWFHEAVPGVPDTGPYNPHFVRDVGVVYTVAGLCLLWAALDRNRAYAIHIVVALLFGGHAILHVADILAGNLPRDHWREDAVGVFVPAVILAALAVPAAWRWVEPKAAKAT